MVPTREARSSVPPAARRSRANRSRLRGAAFAAATAALVLLAACGQRGPLYLPDSGPKKKAQQAAQPASPPPGALQAPRA